MKLGVLLTYGVSIKNWKEVGILDREIKIYKTLFYKYKIKTIFFSFGFKEDRQILKQYNYFEVVPIYEFLNYNKNKYIRLLLSLIAFLFIKKKIEGIDVFKSNQLWGSWSLIIVKLLFSKKIVIRCGYELNKNLENEKGKYFLKLFSKLFSYLVYTLSDCIIVTTDQIKKYIVKSFYINKNKIYIIPNSIDLSLFKINKKKRFKDRLLFIGRNSPEKNLKLIFQTISNKKIILDIIGNGFKKKDLSIIRRKYNIQINYLGKVQNSKLPKFYNKYKLLILPSFYEGNPKVIIEAMACGCIVVGSNIEGIKSIIRDKYNGFLIKDNPKKIFNLIKKILESSNNIIIKNGLKKIKSNYDIRNNIRLEKKIYSKLNAQNNYIT